MAKLSDTDPQGPPFDGSEPCICCPGPVRNLYAVAYNLMLAFDRKNEEPARYMRKWREFGRTVMDFKEYMDEHFADKAHATGQIEL